MSQIFSTRVEILWNEVRNVTIRFLISLIGSVQNLSHI